MGYWISVKGNNSIFIENQYVPRIGEKVCIVPDTFDGQEEELCLRVAEIVHSIGRFGSQKQTPLLILK